MKLLSFLLTLKNKSKKAVLYTSDQKQREALIQTGRQQFIKLERLGLKIPIAVL